MRILNLINCEFVVFTEFGLKYRDVDYEFTYYVQLLFDN